MKTLVKRHQLQKWQAFSALNAEAVKAQVDATYLVYFNEVAKINGGQAMCQLNYRRLVCEEMYKDCSKEMKELVSKRMKEDTLDMPEYLVEVQEKMTEEDVKQFRVNHCNQL